MSVSATRTHNAVASCDGTGPDTVRASMKRNVAAAPDSNAPPASNDDDDADAPCATSTNVWCSGTAPRINARTTTTSATAVSASSGDVAIERPRAAAVVSPAAAHASTIASDSSTKVKPAPTTAF